jgi:hypothetical protein
MNLGFLTDLVLVCPFFPRMNGFPSLKKLFIAYRPLSAIDKLRISSEAAAERRKGKNSPQPPNMTTSHLDFLQNQYQKSNGGKIRALTTKD